MSKQTELVLKINEVFHDVEGKEYQDKHPEIFEDEAKRWRQKQRYIRSDNPQTILDMGTGTGFVPLNIKRSIKKTDHLICSDISIAMLEACEKNIQNISCKKSFLKLDGKKIHLPNESVDIITINAVVHHIPNFKEFFEEIDRVLKPQGLLFIGHEPNKPFYSNRFLWNNSRIMSALFEPMQFISAVTRKLGLFEIARKIYGLISPAGKKDNELYEEVNRILIEQKVISKPLPTKKLVELIDIESPGAGELRTERGVSVDELLKEHLTNYELTHLETYNHLCEVRIKNKFLKKYNAHLKKKYPLKGGTLFAIFKKTKNIKTKKNSVTEK